MKYTFKAKGHENVLATHANTLELTKDTELSRTGDCIIAVAADFSLPEIKKIMFSAKTFLMTISAGGIEEKITFLRNNEFDSDQEIVLRLSEFNSVRTLGFRATKSAKMLNRKLVDELKKKNNPIKITIEPLVSAIIFDFDDTIEDLNVAMDFTHDKIAERLDQEYKVYKMTGIKVLEEVDMYFSQKGVGAEPKLYERHLWFEETFNRLGIKASRVDIDRYVTLYWRFMIEAAKPMPYAADVLSELKKRYKIAVMSDSDGSKRLKDERLKTVGLAGFVDCFITSDDVGINKPNRKFYEKVFSCMDVTPERCVMVGDKPQVDLEIAKRLGMKTVWMKHGRWASVQGETHFHYVDHEIKDLKELAGLVKQL